MSVGAHNHWTFVTARCVRHREKEKGCDRERQGRVIHRLIALVLVASLHSAMNNSGEPIRSLERTTGKRSRLLVNSGSVLACPWSLIYEKGARLFRASPKLVCQCIAFSFVTSASLSLLRFPNWFPTHLSAPPAVRPRRRTLSCGGSPLISSSIVNQLCTAVGPDESDPRVTALHRL